MTSRARIGDFVLTRSDAGDGGWSLHAPGSTDEQIASGAAAPVLTGTARWDEAAGDWTRPSEIDYRHAIEAYCGLRDGVETYTAEIFGPSWGHGPTAKFGSVQECRDWAEDYGTTADWCRICETATGRIVALHQRTDSGWYDAGSLTDDGGA